MKEGLAVPDVTLRAMSEKEFEPWRELSIHGHAVQTARSTGMSIADAETQSRQLLPRILPEGRGTKGMHFLIVLDSENNNVGSLWLGPHPDDASKGYVYDIEIREAYRGRNLGRSAMLAVEDYFRELGVGEIGLWVFGANDVAYSLYTALGYTVVGTSMSKALPE
jgi:ribosomal protein S18 acetylase RimI-like enzyme